MDSILLKFSKPYTLLLRWEGHPDRLLLPSWLKLKAAPGAGIPGLQAGWMLAEGLNSLCPYGVDAYSKILSPFMLERELLKDQFRSRKRMKPIGNYKPCLKSSLEALTFRYR